MQAGDVGASTMNLVQHSRGGEALVALPQATACDQKGCNTSVDRYKSWCRGILTRVARAANRARFSALLAALLIALPAQSAPLGRWAELVGSSIRPASALTSQTITFGTLAGKTFGAAPFTVSATASSGLTVSFASLTTPVCTVAGTTVTIVAAGTCTIQASQAGNATYAAAPNVNQSFTVAKAAQTITFGTLTGKTFGNAPFTVSATASSGLAVTFISTTTAVCTVSTTTVTIVAAGTCTIQAQQAGNGNYNAATNVNQSFTIAKATQTITFGTLAGQTYGAAPFAVSATATSGLAVTFVSTTTAVCTVSTATVTIVAAGTCTIQAQQAGNTNYLAATSVNQSFTVAKAPQTITFGTLASRAFGSGTFTVSATASSGLAVTFTSTTTSICTVSSTTVTLVAVGTCTIQAAQAGNANYLAATNIPQSFSITKGTQTITFGALSNRAFGSGTFALSATASSGLAVTFTSTTTSICTVSSTTVTLVAVGTCTIQAAQAGNANWNAATNVNQSFSITQGTQTISFTAPGNHALGSGTFTLTATATSGLTVTFTSLTTPVCTVSVKTVTLVSTGTCTIQAAQAGNSNWSAAPTVNQSFTVTLATQTITFNALPARLWGTPPFTISATATSGLTVTFFAQSPSVCTVNGSTVTLLNIGSCVIEAAQDGNSNYLAATVTRSFRVIAAPQFAETDYGTSESASLGVGDFNRDGVLDVFARGPNGYLVYPGRGDGTLGAPIQTYFSFFAGSTVDTVAAVGDFNGDGKLDVVVAINSGLSGTTYLAVSLGNGDGTFQSPVLIPTSATWSMAVGDLNQDGRTDLVFSDGNFQGYEGTSIEALQGDSVGGLIPASGYGVGNNPQGVALGDFNGDGKLDIVVVNMDDNTFSILLGNGDGTFAPPVTYAAHHAPISVTVGDFNGDGKLDLAIANQIDNTVSIFLGHGDGTFSGATDYTVGTRPFQVLAADFNGDGSLDLAVANAGDADNGFNASVVILPGAGDGSFLAPIVVESIWPPLAIAVADLNADGKPDLLVSDGALAVFLNLGTTSPTATIAVQAGSGQSTSVNTAFPTALAALVRNASSQPIAGQLVTFAAPSGSPSGTFAGANIAQATTNASGIATAPTFTANGVAGSFSVAASIAGATTVFALTNTGAGQQAPVFITGPPPDGAIGLPYSFTVAASGNPAPTYSALANALPTGLGLNGTSGLINGTPSVGGTFAGQLTASNGVNPNATQNFAINIAQATQVVNFGALLGQTFGAAPFTVSANASSGLLVSFISLTTGVCTVAGATVTMITGGTCTIQAQQAGNATYAAAPNVSVSFTVGKASQTISFAPLFDKTLSQSPITVAATASSGLAVTFTSTTTPVCTVAGTTVTLVTTGTCTIQAAQAGNTNYLAATSVSQTFTVKPNGTDQSPTVSFVTPANNSTYVTPAVIPLLVNASDPDGTIKRVEFYSGATLIGTSTTAPYFYLWKGMATGGYSVTAKAYDNQGVIATTGAVTLNVNATGSTVSFVRRDQLLNWSGAVSPALAVVDFNGDAKLDVALSFPGNNVFDVYRGAGNAQFDEMPGPGIDAGAPCNFTELVVGDFNGDGKPDLAASSLEGCISVMLSRGDGTFQTGVSVSTGKTVNGLVAADLNGDGKLDLAATNDDGTVTILIGNGNGTFQAPVSIPVGTYLTGIAAGDVNGDGKLDLVVGGEPFGLAVLLGNGNGTFQAPTFISLGLDFPEQIALADFNGDGKLDIAVTTGGNTVAVLIGYGNGTFQPPADYPAGYATQGIAIADFDGDGALDIAAVDGWGFGGAAILLGNGNGTFHAPVIYSIDSNPTHVVVADIDGNGNKDLVFDGDRITTLLNITHLATSAPQFTNAAPPDGNAASAYAFTFTASGVPAPYFSVSNLAASGTTTFATTGTLTIPDPGGSPPSGYIASGTVTASNGISPDATYTFEFLMRSAPTSISFSPALGGDMPLAGNGVYSCGGVSLDPISIVTTPPSTLISLTPAVCYVDSNVNLHVNAVGTCVLRAEYNGTYVDKSFNVVPLPANVVMTAPADHSGFTAPASIPLTATACHTVAGSTISEVDFYNGTTQIGSATTSPWTINWNNVASGTYTITATAVENKGQIGEISTNSSPITVVVTASPDQPSVSLTAPAASGVYMAPATIALAANATDPTGTIAKVDFYANQYIVGTATSSPYTTTWTNAPAGNYTLTAKATSANGVVSTSAPVTVSVDTGLPSPVAVYAFDAAWGSPPIIRDNLSYEEALPRGNVTQVSAPAAGAKPDTCQAASFAGGTIDFDTLGVAVDPGAATTVAFWMYWNGTDGAMPVSLNTEGLLFAGGGFGFTTTGTDVYGIASASLASGWHHVVALFVNGSVTGNTLYIDGVAQSLTQRSGTPNNANAVVGPSLRLGAQVGTGAYPFAGKLDELAVYGGRMSAAQAAGLVTTANPCATVSVRIVSPPNNTTYYLPADTRPALVEIVAAAESQSGGGISSSGIEFFHDGVSMGVGYGHNQFDVPFVAPGTYVLTAKATDINGATAVSAPVTITIAQAPGHGSVAITGPPSGTTVYTSGWAFLQANVAAAPSYGIDEVVVLANGVPIGFLFGPPWVFDWRNPNPGTYQIVFQVHDNAGYMSSSAPITITVSGTDPTVTYFYNDLTGSPLAAADEQGTVFWLENYEPYGARYLKEDDGTLNGLWYTGKPVEDATGLSYFGGRWYNAAYGRFYSVDPQTYKESTPATFNLYAYGNNNPYRFVDPSGNEGVEIRSSSWLRVAVPGQGSWDNARTEWANGNVGAASIWAAAMVEEQLLFVGTLGLSQAASAARASTASVQASSAAAGAGTAIVESTARQEASRGTSYLFEYLTTGERAAYLANPAGGSRFLGQGAHRATASALEKAYPGRFSYSTRGPDFLDKLTGEVIELTTPGQVGAHAMRDPYTNIVTYSLP